MAWFPNALTNLEHRYLVLIDNLALSQEIMMKNLTMAPVIYSSETRVNVGVLEAPVLMIKEIFSMKWQIWIGFKKGFDSAHRNSVLGVLWAVVLPLIPVSVYLILAQIRVLKSSEDMPFILFIVLGMVIYLFMTGAIISVMNSLEHEKNILKKVKYPISAAMLSNFGGVAFDFAIRTCFVIPLLIYYGTGWHFGILLLPLVLLILFVFSMAVGIILAITSVLLPDLKHVANLAVAYGLFMSSVIFPMPREGAIGSLTVLNPLNTFVNATRELVVFGKIEEPIQFLAWAAMSVFLVILACKLSYSMEFRIKEYL
jgi:ABC-type polysaccharide/polyol phosphate export permease